MIPLIYHPIYSQLDLPVGHRYPINKYRLLYEDIVHQQAQSEEWRDAFGFFTPQIAELSLVESLHDSEYVQALLDGLCQQPRCAELAFLGVKN